MIDVLHCRIKGTIEDRVKMLADAKFSEQELSINNLRHRDRYSVFSLMGSKEALKDLENDSIEIIPLGSIDWKHEFEIKKHIYIKVKGADVESVRKILSNMFAISIADGEVFCLEISQTFVDAIDYIKRQLNIKINRQDIQNGMFYHAGKLYAIRFASQLEDFE